MINNPDLHMHTYYSDGKEAPAVVVRRALKADCDVCAITDHDGMGGVEEAVAEGKRLGLPVIRGVEFSAVWEAPVEGFEGVSHYMHILGYGMDPGYEPLKKKLAFILEKRAVRNESLRQIFVAKGYPMTMEELKSYAVNGFVGKVAFARLFTDRGVCERPEEAFDRTDLLASPEVKAVHRYKIPAEEAIALINGAGGKAFFAHPFQLSFKPDRDESDETYRRRMEAVIRGLAQAGLAGIECYYPTHSPEQTEFLLDMAKRLGLLVSRGSDDHGENARLIKRMGNFSTQPDLSVLQWIEDFI